MQWHRRLYMIHKIKAHSNRTRLIIIRTLNSMGVGAKEQMENLEHVWATSEYPSLAVIHSRKGTQLMAPVYCRRRKIRCLPPVGNGDRCQNCHRQQRECVVQPIAGSTRKGGR